MLVLALNATSFGLAFPFALLLGGGLIARSTRQRWRVALAQFAVAQMLSSAVFVVALPIGLVAIAGVGGLLLPRSAAHLVMGVTGVGVEGTPAEYGALLVCSAFVWLLLSWGMAVPVESAILREVLKSARVADGGGVARAVVLKTNLCLGPVFLFVTALVWNELFLALR